MAPERIPLQRAVAAVSDDSIVVHPARAQVLAAVAEILVAAVAVALIVLLFDALPLFVLMALLLLAIIVGPIGVLGLVYGVIGTSFVMSRKQQSAQWQQGFLGMGIGTNEFVPFSRIARIEVTTDADERLSAGERQDLVQWDVRLVKDNARVLTVGTVVAARPLADRGAERANWLGAALAEMAGVEVRLAPLPEAATEEAVAPAPRPRRRYRRIAAPPVSASRQEEP